MKSLFKTLVLDKVEDGSGGGEKVTPEQPAPGQKPPENTAPPEEGGSDTDEFGYKKTKTEGDKKPEDKSVEPEEKEKPIEPGTGYGDKPLEKPPEDEKKPDEKKPDEKEKPPEEGEVKFDEKDLLPDEIKKIKEFAKKHKLSPEAAKDLADEKRAEIKAMKDNGEAAKLQMQKEAEKAIAKRKYDWDQELRNDPVFGKENYSTNVKGAEKVLNDFWPEWKKELTEGKRMLPPNVMRGLAKVAESVYDTEKIVTGDPTKAKPDSEKDENLDAHLDFYNQGKKEN